MIGRSSGMRFLAWVAGCVLCAGAAAAQQRLYKYQDENGVWVYTDRRPDAAQPFEETEFGRTVQRPEIRILQRVVNGELALVAQNTYFAPVQIAFELTRMANLADDAPRRGLTVVPARSDGELLVARRADASRPLEIEYRFDYLLGDPNAEHAPTEPYRLPYALATGHEVSQAFPNTVTHNDLASQHAI